MLKNNNFFFNHKNFLKNILNNRKKSRNEFPYFNYN